MNLDSFADEEFCYLTTTGRATGEPHEIEIWFSLIPERRTLFLMAGGRYDYDWVKNLLKNPKVHIRIAGETFVGYARPIEGEEDESLARRLLVEKYEKSPGSLDRWGQESLTVAVEIRQPDTPRKI